MYPWSCLQMHHSIIGIWFTTAWMSDGKCLNVAPMQMTGKKSYRLIAHPSNSIPESDPFNRTKSELPKYKINSTLQSLLLDCWAWNTICFRRLGDKTCPRPPFISRKAILMLQMALFTSHHFCNAFDLWLIIISRGDELCHMPSHIVCWYTPHIITFHGTSPSLYPYRSWCSKRTN